MGRWGISRSPVLPVEIVQCNRKVQAHMLVQLQKNFSADARESRAAEDAGLLSVVGILAILRRRALLIACSIVAMLFVGVFYLATTKPMFGSTALVYLDIQNAQVIEGNGSASGMKAGLDDVDVNSQLQIIRSEKIATSVIEKLGIAGRSRNSAGRRT